MDAATLEVPGEAQGHGNDIAGTSRVEQWLIALILTAMAVFTVLEVLGRTTRGIGVPGGLEFTQHLTLWVGFVGAFLATATGGHLSLATHSLFTNERLKQVARLYSGALSVAVCVVLCVASVMLVRATADTKTLPGGIPEWWSELVMPVALAGMAVRFAYRASTSWSVRAAILLVGLSALALHYTEGFSSSIVWPGALLIAVGLVLGMPVFAAMAGLAMLLFFSGGQPIASVPNETFRLVASPSLPAIPLLTATGYVLAEGGASHRFLRLARAWFGWMPGGLALMVVGVCAVFTTFTGGSGVTLLALGGIVLPLLKSEKYPEDFSLGLVTASGSLGLLFPPSLPVILYAVVAGASISDLYLAGLVPGVLMMLLIAGYAILTGRAAKVPRHPFVLKEALVSIWEAKWELAIPALVVITMMGALATPVEASGLALTAAVLVELFVMKGFKSVGELLKVLAKAGTLVGAVLMLLGVAMGLTYYLVDADVQHQVVDWSVRHIHSPHLFLLALNVLLLLVGSTVEIFAAIVVLAPLIAPMAHAYGIDPLHLGIVFLANLELGFLLPPMGLNLILASSRFGVPLVRLYRVILPFFAILAVGLLVVTYVPQTTVGVVDKLRKREKTVEAPLTPGTKGTTPQDKPKVDFDWDAP